MIRSITKDIICVGNDKSLKTFFTGTAKVTQRIVELRWEQSADTNVVLYRNQDLIVEVGGECEQNDYFPVPVDLEVTDGEIIQAGFVESAGATPTIKLTLFVEEKGG